MRQRKKKPLKHGMVYCRKCKGNGLIKPYRIETLFGNKKISNKCPHCKGKGQINWMDNLLGKKPQKPYFLDILNDLNNFKSHSFPIVTASQSTGKSIFSLNRRKHNSYLIPFIDYVDLISPYLNVPQQFTGNKRPMKVK